nr:ketosamine-3-kinase-like [Lytechinus pictus]XP_054749572.1 ketosamine-3-kinase-like [Lytechinus pictus]XP_054768893.1 ketosamine-3-kinase-like [Lytechinus pictus]
MEKILKDAVGATTIKSMGRAGGGCISDGQSYDTDKGKFFVKINEQSGARQMFDGEKASLDAILATETIKVPRPGPVLDHPSGTGAIFIMEYLDLQGLGKHSAALGEQLARLHLHNIELGKRARKVEGRIGAHTSEGFINQYGFQTPTCCGYLPLDNTWSDDWVSFYTQQRLKMQIDMLEKKSSDKELREMWPLLERRIPKLFEGSEITPSLLHGDLWGGNAGQLESCPVVYDPASFYGHHEFDLSIGAMFHSFSQAFHKAYHKLIPKATGFEGREKLYLLFHHLNHWNHFGSSYRGSSLSIMRGLLKD